jgi:hypothetical protein
MNKARVSSVAVESASSNISSLAGYSLTSDSGDLQEKTSAAIKQTEKIDFKLLMVVVIAFIIGV